MDLFQLSEPNNSQILTSAGILIIFLLVLLQKSLGCKESDGALVAFIFKNSKRILHASIEPRFSALVIIQKREDKTVRRTNKLHLYLW